MDAIPAVAGTFFKNGIGLFLKVQKFVVSNAGDSKETLVGIQHGMLANPRRKHSDEHIPDACTQEIFIFRNAGRICSINGNDCEARSRYAKTAMLIRCIVDIIGENDVGRINEFNYVDTEK
ncbi:hypothetical protein [Burkholderia pseudomallei]|uniref:hypothetical protein n=1 Tax=Burkholderia pseudomallei TaxID=28450 RepID=UPI0018A21467|nr:hypothetical protein [Burkholderia pseudomallei]